MSPHKRPTTQIKGKKLTLHHDLAVRPDDPAADSRDMVAVHDVFHRQFRKLVGLLASAPHDRPNDVQVLTNQAQLLMTIFHANHGGEDAIVWPRNKARGGDEPSAAIG